MEIRETHCDTAEVGRIRNRKIRKCISTELDGSDLRDTPKQRFLPNTLNINE